jgi:hypothetical protein
MARQRGTRDMYTGRSGQMAVMAELLFRLCNAAIPEVDAGTDVFAFQDEREEVARVQVKTAQGERYRRGRPQRSIQHSLEAIGAARQAAALLCSRCSAGGAFR